MFGIGGSEWLVIAAVVVMLLLVPGVLVFGAGFLLGKRAGEGAARPHEDVSAGERTFQPEQAEPVSEPVEPAGESALPESHPPADTDGEPHV